MKHEHAKNASKAPWFSNPISRGGEPQATQSQPVDQLLKSPYEENLSGAPEGP